ncbi:MAG: hypothetical protein FWG10_14620 [Eubacteriaceae bacterium]|nr:hypothetical protein [Eubacteriaceae bacterium]
MDGYIIPVFFDIDNFCNEFEAWIASCEETPMPSNTGKRAGSKSIPPSEAMAIAVMSRHPRYRKFKRCCLDPAKGGWAPCFRRLPSYNRFLELVK